METFFQLHAILFKYFIKIARLLLHLYSVTSDPSHSDHRVYVRITIRYSKYVSTLSHYHSPSDRSRLVFCTMQNRRRTYRFPCIYAAALAAKQARNACNLQRNYALPRQLRGHGVQI